MLKLSYTPNWNRMSRSTGYPVVYCPDHPNAWSTGYVYAHRVIMEQSIGRILTPSEVVHHLDHNRNNYELSNLELTTQSNHIRTHTPPKTILDMICANCGVSFKRRKGQDPEAKGYARTFCSRSCSGSFTFIQNQVRK